VLDVPEFGRETEGAARLIRQTFSGSDVMIGRTSLLKASALALPFSLAAAAAHAASIAETVQQQAELSTFAQAMEAAKFAEELSGQGPYTVFAPTDQAFEHLPAGALDELMKQEHQAQLARLLEHHVVEGQAIAADALLGTQSQVDTMAGDSLTVDGTSQVVLVVPSASAAATPTAQGTDMPMTQHQQQALKSHPAPEQQQTAAQGTGDMPMTEHQQQALKSHPTAEQQQTAAQGTGDLPATQHQQQVLQDQQGQQQAQQGAAGASTAQGSDMPMTEHQQQALKSHPAPEQQQTAAEGTGDMPATAHQQQVLQDQQGQQQAHGQSGATTPLREATVVGADIQADNGVIHVIDVVLLPQDVLQTLEQTKQN
jgi:uncharacterized surface protein with fasciclin (FAS1) repeats